jgi:hypothetical protein
MENVLRTLIEQSDDKIANKVEFSPLENVLKSILKKQRYNYYFEFKFYVFILLKDHLIKTLQIQENYMHQLKIHFEKESEKIQKKHNMQLSHIENCSSNKKGSLFDFLIL